MNGKRIDLQMLLGRMVKDTNGEKVGRIEEFRAEEQNGETVITHYLVGRRGLRERLSISGLALTFIRPFGAQHVAATHKIPWEKLDLSDPKHPKLRGRKDEVQEIG